MMDESVKKSHEKSKNVLEEKRKNVKRKICIKNIARRIPEATRRVRTSQKNRKCSGAITICIKPLTHYLPRPDLKFGDLNTCHQEKQNSKFLYYRKRLVTLKNSEIINMVKKLMG